MTATQLKYELFEEELIAPLRGHVLTEEESLVASLLLDAKSSRPIGIKHIVEVLNSRRRGASPTVREGSRRRVNDRAVKDIIRTLRKDHEFPILSRKFARPAGRDEAGNATEVKPAGYWWCGSEAEMLEWANNFRKQPMDELHTLSRIVKANYPKLVGQLSLQDVSAGPDWCGNKDGQRVADASEQSPNGAQDNSPGQRPG